jgi:FtsZ-binding cell division protein ZapB
VEDVMKFTKGKEMEILVFVFVACIVTMFAAIYVYNQKESTAFHNTHKMILDLSVKVRELEALLTSNITTIAQSNLKVKELEHKIICFTGVVESNQKEIENLQEHCAKLREGQIQIRDKIAGKRPILKVTTPVPVQVVSPSSPELIKKVKKQMKGLSQ